MLIEVLTCFVPLEIMIELCRREKAAGILPDPDIDTFMKVVLTYCMIC